MDPALLSLGERIDQLMTVDVPNRGVIPILYQAARQVYGQPLALLAAQLLSERVTPGTIVLIATGWPDRPHVTREIAESDGPPGAAVLARMLHRVLGAVPIVLIEEWLCEGMAEVMGAAGFRVLSPENALASAQSSAPIHGASVLALPTEPESAERVTVELLNLYETKAVISIEKGGMNEYGKIHTSRGADTTDTMGKADMLIRGARQRGILTIGVGDGGNEIGMGTIRNGLVDKLPYSRQCRCGCGGGIIPAEPTDVVVTATVSNWGAYGVAAALSALHHVPHHLHSANEEQRILEASARAKFIDGISGFVEPTADGISLDGHKAFVTLLAEIVCHG